MDVSEIIKSKPIFYIFLVVFVSYFIFYQITDRLLLFVNLNIPPPYSVILSTSPPVPPSQMPFPLWGPFLSITTRYFTWALTPLSIIISIGLSILVATNVVLYIYFYRAIKLGAKRSIVASLGLIATSLSCSCELFTGLIGSAVASLPFLVSITFMDTLSEVLVFVAFVLLTISSYVIYREINWKKSFPFGLDKMKRIILGAIILALTSIVVPSSPAFSFVKLITSTFSGGIIASSVNVKFKHHTILFIASVVLIIATLTLFNVVSSSPIIPLIGLISGLMGYEGVSNMKRWAKLGILHVIAWTMIMPGPISLILGYPIPFLSLSQSDLLQMWIYSWIIGTPIAWYAGIYYLQYLRDSMAELREVRINISPSTFTALPGIKWIAIGGLALFLQLLFFLTHVAYYVDYNGYDYLFLTEMTLISTIVMVSGSIAVGYGIYEIIKSKLGAPKVKRKDLLAFGVVYGLITATVGGIIHFGVSGFTYPHFYVFTYGIPMLNPALLVYLPPVLGIYVNPLEVLQLITVSLMGGYLLSLIKTSYDLRKNAFVLTMGGFSICPSCVLSTYVLGVISTSLGVSVMFSLFDQLLFSFASDVVMLFAFVYTLKKNKTYCELGLSK